MTSPTPHTPPVTDAHRHDARRWLQMESGLGWPLVSMVEHLAQEYALRDGRTRAAALKEAAEIARAAENQHRQNMTELDEAFAAGLIAQAIESRMSEAKTAPPEGK